MSYTAHLNYSLYDNRYDFESENDPEELKRECMRQHIFIERLYAEKNKAEFETHLMKMSKLNWSNLMWKLVKDFREGKQTKEEFLDEFDRIREGMCRIL